jgi:hypothetical protein
MNEGGDKMVTNAGAESATRTKPRRSRAKKKPGPFLKVKFGSAAVPIYRTESKGSVRYTLSFYRHGRRMRKAFKDLESAKKEALFVAQRIQVGMQHVTDLKPHERDSFKAAEALLRKSGIPLVAAIEDYTRHRQDQPREPDRPHARQPPRRHRGSRKRQGGDGGSGDLVWPDGRV